MTHKDVREPEYAYDQLAISITYHTVVFFVRRTVWIVFSLPSYLHSYINFFMVLGVVQYSKTLLNIKQDLAQAFGN